MISVKNLLKIKGKEVWSVTPETTALVALKSMAEKDIGALLVLENDEIAGIVSERDFVRSISSTGQCVLDAPIKNFMTKNVITITSENTIEECMKIMSQKKIRHLPVVDEKKVVGVISLRDVVAEVISSRESTITQLENFIEGREYPK
jgi:CBS domain-containing protein